MASSSKLIRDIHNRIWKFSPEKGKVYLEEGDEFSTRDSSGFKAKTYEEALQILTMLGVFKHICGEQR